LGFSDAPINIEIKGGRADIEHAALHITEGTGAEERTIVFSENTIHRFRETSGGRVAIASLRRWS
jgi:hypothetical protein